MELTTDHTKFFTIICRDGMLQVPLKIVKYVGVFKDIKSSDNTFYTSDKCSTINELVSLFCDSDKNTMHHLIENYDIKTDGIVQDDLYRSYEHVKGNKYYDCRFNSIENKFIVIPIHHKHITICEEDDDYCEYDGVLNIADNDIPFSFSSEYNTKNDRIHVLDEEQITIKKSEISMFFKNDRLNNRIIEYFRGIKCNKTFYSLLKHYGSFDKLKSALLR